MHKPSLSKKMITLYTMGAASFNLLRLQYLTDDDGVEF